MLHGQPVVFISCSEKFKLTVARPIRTGLSDVRVRGVIVSDEPALPRTGWTADDKVESYLDASDAFLALCTADNELADGTFECRQNIISEIERARKKPHLRDKIMVFKEASVRLPSNINPIYERLEPGSINEAIHLMVRQLQTWGVIAARASLQSTIKSAIDLDGMVNNINLGDHDKATRLAYETALETTRADQLLATKDLLARLRSNTGDPHIMGHIPNRLHRLRRVCAEPRCENFLYGFQGGPPGRSRRRHGALAFAPADAPATAAPTPVGWRESEDASGPQSTEKFQDRGRI